MRVYSGNSDSRRVGGCPVSHGESLVSCKSGCATMRQLTSVPKLPAMPSAICKRRGGYARRGRPGAEHDPDGWILALT